MFYMKSECWQLTGATDPDLRHYIQKKKKRKITQEHSDS